MKDSIKRFLSRFEDIKLNPKNIEECKLPENCWFLDDSTVICNSRKAGDSRYPYSTDGYTLWAYSSGYMCINESTFYTLLLASGGKEPFLTVFGGVKTGEEYKPVSLFDVTANDNNPERYTVYTPKAVYYVVKEGDVIFALRAFVDDKKQVYFTLFAENTGSEKQSLYLSPYFNFLLKHDTAENVETNWFKECKTTENGYLFGSVEDLDRFTHLDHYGVFNRAVSSDCVIEKTTARTVYTGGLNVPIVFAECLKTGVFKKEKYNTRFTDVAVAAEIIKFELGAGENFTVDYKLTYTADKKIAEDLVSKPLCVCEAGEVLAKLQQKYNEKNSKMMEITFGKTYGKLNEQLFNKFIKNVQRQVEFAALSKNSGVALLGVRDVFQQLEAALIWNPTDCKAKILEALGFIGIDGRPARQYSIPPKEGVVPRMDLRPFIDQGVWIIDTLYTYLAFTGDYSILDEVCGYYKFVDRETFLSDEKDSVYCHLIRIIDYMISKLDYGHTNCLRAIYGDWNDALDGLGESLDGSSDYGTGVSVMATLQLFRNLTEIKEIIANYNGDNALIDKYSNVQKTVKEGLREFAIEKQGENLKVLHGWGDKRSYKIGSFCDPDGVSRDTLTASAFWIISEMIKEEGCVKDAIVEGMHRLDSKYGLKTFEPYFPLGMKGVGRIINLVKGTAENAATYVHATLFGIWALFLIGETEFAWEQLYKALPITHEYISTTPFIMSNSYSYNEEYGMDGESMSDWYTGSANVLIKILVKCVLGINPDLQGVTIAPAKNLPAENVKIKLNIKGAAVTVEVVNENVGERKFFINQKAVNGVYDEQLKTQKIYIKKEDLVGDIHIKVIN